MVCLLTRRRSSRSSATDAVVRCGSARRRLREPRHDRTAMSRVPSTTTCGGKHDDHVFGSHHPGPGPRAGSSRLRTRRQRPSPTQQPRTWSVASAECSSSTASATGQGVAVLSPPRPEAWMVMSAASLVGARVSALHPLGSLDDHIYMCDDAEIHTLVVDSSAAERASRAARAGGDREARVLARPVTRRRGSGRPRPVRPMPRRCRARRSSSDICWLVYTGGTTGRPKGVVDTHRVMASMALTALAEYELPTKRPLPGRVADHPRRGDARRADAAARRHRVPAREVRPRELPAHDRVGADLSLLRGPEHGVRACSTTPISRRTDLSSLETFLYAASPMSPARLADGLERIGPVFTQYYAQSECPAATVLAQRHHDPSIPGRSVVVRQAGGDDPPGPAR